MEDRAQFLDAEDLRKRIRGITNFVVPDEALRDEICQRALVKILGALTRGAFLRKIVRSVFIDYLRERDQQLPEEDKLVFNPPQPEPEAPPLEVIEARLRMLYTTGESRPHEALCFAYNVHLGRAPAAIVSELARIPLENLSRSYIDDYVRASGIPRDRIEGLFHDLVSISGTPVGQSELSDYWDPPTVVGRWASTEPSPEDGPARRIAFLFHKELRYEPWQIVTRLGHHTLDELTVQFVDEYGAMHGESVEQVRERFSSWLDVSGVSARRRLSFYYDPPRCVSHWANAVHRRLESAEAAVEKAGIRVIIESGPPHETIAFLLTYILRMAAADVARQYAKTKLSWLTQKLTEAYEENRNLNTNQAQSWFDPLRKRLASDIAGEKSLSDYFPAGAQDPAQNISAWRVKTLQAVRLAFDGRRDLIVFAHRYNLLPRVRR